MNWTSCGSKSPSPPSPSPPYSAENGRSKETWLAGTPPELLKSYRLLPVGGVAALGSVVSHG